MSILLRNGFTFGLALVLLLLSASSLSAHSELDRCAPAPNAVLKAAPKEIRCTFSGSVVVDTSALAVFDAVNTQVDNKDTKLDAADEDDLTLVVSLNTSKMAKGIYRVQWAVVSEADGDRTTGQWTFTLDIETSSSAGTTGTPGAPPATPTQTSPATTEDPAQTDPEAGSEESSATTTAEATETPPAPAMPPGPSAQDLPAGTGGMVARNFYGRDLTFTFNGVMHTIPSISWLLITVSPGSYSYSANVFGDDCTETSGTAEIKAGELTERPFFLWQCPVTPEPPPAEEEEEGEEDGGGDE